MLPDITGLTLDEFHIDSRLGIVSGEADIYLCSGTGSHSGKRFLLKYYRRENAVKQDVLEKLKSVNSPFVAQVEGFGEYQEHQYVVRPYYEMSALSELLAGGTRFSEEELKSLIIPSIIEGLKAVHDVGILHKDLKPANLIPDNTGEHIVIIDFGISSDAGKNTFVVTQTGMTPFYAAPEAMQGIFHKETDYYALGITIFELFTGFTPFQNPGLAPEEVARLAAISKIEFPKNFPEDLKKLVLGLTYKDISNRNDKDNPNRRWGYDEAKRWLDGEDVPVPGDTGAMPGNRTTGEPAFQAYRFAGKTYTVETELLRAMLEHPNDALRDLGRGILSHYYYGISEEKGDLVAAAENKLESCGQDTWKQYRIIYLLIWSIRPDIKELFFNGKVCGNIQELGKAFIDVGTREAAKNGSLHGDNFSYSRVVKDFIISGIPEDYAGKVLKNPALKDLFSKTASLWINDSHSASDTELSLILGYGLCSDRRIPVKGKIYESPAIFQREMNALAKRDREAYMNFVLDARKDLDFLEQRLPDSESRKAISDALEESRWAVFGNNEYLFKNGHDFENFIKRLVQEERPHELRSIFNRYKTPLKNVSSVVWKTKSKEELEKIVSGFIQIGEYLFTGEKTFLKFIKEVIERGKKDPWYILRFVKAHRDSLNLAVMEHPKIKDAVASLYSANDDVIVFDEKVFTGISEFQAFVNFTLSRGRKDPWYLAGFIKRHGNAIKELEQKNEYHEVLEPLNKAFQNLIIFDSRIFTAVSDFESYINDIITKGKKDPGFLCSYVEKHKRELSELGEQDNRLGSILKKIFKVRNQLVFFDEYVFSTVDEFRVFAKDVLKTGRDNPAYLKRFVSEHEKSLARLCFSETLSQIVKELKDAADGVIELDEYVFSDVAGFNSFVAEFRSESTKKPRQLSDFTKEHKSVLEAIRANANVAKISQELLDAENQREKEDYISVNGTKYMPVTSIKFGSYPQQEGDSKEPIEWLILEMEGNEALLISRFGLDRKRYHNNKTDMVWEKSDLRRWLNDDFLKNAFSEEERQRIIVSEVPNYNNHLYGTNGGFYTWDQIFCLSIEEAKSYFKSNDERRCQSTALLKAQRIHVNEEGYCSWWLRSPGIHQNYASYVMYDGDIVENGFDLNCSDVVRPCLRIIWDQTSQICSRISCMATSFYGQKMVQFFENEEENQKNLLQGDAATGVDTKASRDTQIQQKEEITNAEDTQVTVKKGGYIMFGSYPQNHGSLNEPIEWLVLEVQGNEALIISRYGIDCKQYHRGGSTTWQDCVLRNWLNDDFLNKAFTEHEQKRIKLSEVINEDRPDVGTSGGDNTQDRLFCLSIGEAELYFKNKYKRQCLSTEYARKQASCLGDSNNLCEWWLRSPGRQQNHAAKVRNFGAVNGSNNVLNQNTAVRPALWLFLDQ